MSSLETAFERLAGALDTLETKLDSRLDELESTTEAHDQARRRARIAGAYTRSAASELAASIGDLKALIDETGDAGTPPATGRDAVQPEAD